MRYGTLPALAAALLAAACTTAPKPPVDAADVGELKFGSTTLLKGYLARGELPELDVEITADVILAATAPHLYGFQRHSLGYSQQRIAAGLRRLFVDSLRRGLTSL